MTQMELAAREQGPDSNPMMPLLLQGRTGFTVYERGAPGRGELEHRIRHQFDCHFGARIGSFMPELACYRHPHGATAVVGMRAAANETLFLEAYLGMPIEKVVRRVGTCDTPRSRIVEVGQFVVDDRAAVARFFVDLVPFLAGRGYDWVCFTGTRVIRTRLARIGFHGLELTTAAEARVRPTDDRWGRYYMNEPVVTLGKLDDPRGDWFRRAHTDRPVVGTGSCPR